MNNNNNNNNKISVSPQIDVIFWRNFYNLVYINVNMGEYFEFNNIVQQYLKQY